MAEAVIVSTARTPIGKAYRGAFNNTHGATLAGHVIEKAQGNPFYVEELLNYLRDRGIDPQDTAALQSLDLPSSLHTLILSRIDQLSAQQQAELKVASVIGRTFALRDIVEAHRHADTDHKVGNVVIVVEQV
jgi:predicted ATPase